MGVIFVLIGGFSISWDISMSSSSKSAKVWKLFPIWRRCSAFFIRSEHTWTFLVSFTILGRLELDPFVGFFKSKDTFCDSLFWSVLSFCFLAAFWTCLSVFAISDSFLYLASSECHVSSVLTATRLVIGFGAAATAAYVLPTTFGAAVSTSFLASGNDSLFCTRTCWTCFSCFHCGHSLEYPQLMQTTSLTQALLSWSNRPQRAHVSLPRQVFCPCPKQRKGFGINGSTGMLR